MSDVRWLPEDIARRVWARKKLLEELAQKMYPGGMEMNCKRKCEIVSFWHKHGLIPTQDAFGVSRATLFRWQAQVQSGKLQLRSTVPKRKRVRIVHPLLRKELIRMRCVSPRLGKEKLYPLLREYSLLHNLPILSISTIGRLIADFKHQGALPTGNHLKLLGKSGRLIARERKRVKKLRRGSFMPKLPGDLVELDTVVTNIDGTSRYTRTAVDVHSRLAFAWSYTSSPPRPVLTSS
jgi:hypothetical protein